MQKTVFHLIQNVCRPFIMATGHPMGMTTGLLGVMLAGCTPRLDSEAIAQRIQADLEGLGDVPVESVVCPQPIQPEPGTAFQCVGIMDSDQEFVIQVEQPDDPGGILWTIPSSKGLLNLAELEEYFQTSITSEKGVAPVVDCGGLFRVNRPGDEFTCQVTNTVLIENSQLEAIQISLDSQGNVNWQQVLQEVEPALAAEATSAVDEDEEVWGDRPE